MGALQKSTFYGTINLIRNINQVTIPNPYKQTYTSSIHNHPAFKNHMGDLWVAVSTEFKLQPDQCTDGGNDKFFYSMHFLKVKLFIAANEVGGLTVMLPEDY